jgi:dihydroorotase
MELLIRNGLVVSYGTAITADVLIRDGRIAEIGTALSSENAVEYDATGCWVGPGFVDLHTHLREPGGEASETIATGARAAAAGGYTAVIAMPNTTPAMDNGPTVAFVLAQGAKTPITVAAAGAITVGRAGHVLSPMVELHDLGVRLFTDDGSGVQDAGVMRRAMQYAAGLGVRLAQHCEDDSLCAGGSMNEGVVSGRIGLVGRPAVAEEVMVARDIELARETGCPLHFLHLSTARSIALVAEAKAEGLDVTCEVTPHHLTLDETDCATYDSAFKVHPPLRTVHDVAALRRALCDGLIDAVATDHAPHSPEMKDQPFDLAPAGMLGLEHAASLTFEALGGTEADPTLFYRVLSEGPARIAQLREEDARVGLSAQGTKMVPGSEANICVFDPQASWVASADGLQSIARNTPYKGRQLHGRVRLTVSQGVVVNEQGEAK